MDLGLATTDLVPGGEFNDGGVVIDWFNCDGDIGWKAPLVAIKDFKHDPGVEWECV